MEDLAVLYLIPGEIGYVSELNTHGTEEGEVLSDERDGVGTRPERILDVGKWYGGHCTIHFCGSHHNGRGRFNRPVLRCDCQKGLLLIGR